jgi:hypothetical protein
MWRPPTEVPFQFFKSQAPFQLDLFKVESTLGLTPKKLDDIISSGRTILKI